ncbi:hypothetical protein [Bradyrhizobium sp. AZCC 2289]|uniref:hypothetical protein n=1 Tax=Bradyrhizobium sp. AZCC 2289 TaxID=3117026 RepID=UPI002FF0826D
MQAQTDKIWSQSLSVIGIDIHRRLPTAAGISFVRTLASGVGSTNAHYVPVLDSKPGALVFDRVHWRDGECPRPFPRSLPPDKQLLDEELTAYGCQVPDVIERFHRGPSVFGQLATASNARCSAPLETELFL